MTALALYRIADEIKNALACIEDDGEVTPDLAERLDALQLAFEDKVDGLVKYRAGIVTTAEAITAEINRLQTWLDSLDAKADWLKDYLKKCMKDAGLKKLDTPTHKVWIQNNGRPSITLAEGAAIPEQFKHIEVSFDGQAAYEAWKRGETMPESVTVTVGQHLRIK